MVQRKRKATEISVYENGVRVVGAPQSTSALEHSMASSIPPVCDSGTPSVSTADKPEELQREQNLHAHKSQMPEEVFASAQLVKQQQRQLDTARRSSLPEGLVTQLFPFPRPVISEVNAVNATVDMPGHALQTRRTDSLVNEMEATVEMVAKEPIQPLPGIPIRNIRSRSLDSAIQGFRMIPTVSGILSNLLASSENLQEDYDDILTSLIAVPYQQ